MSLVRIPMMKRKSLKLALILIKKIFLDFLDGLIYNFGTAIIGGGKCKPK